MAGVAALAEQLLTLLIRPGARPVPHPLRAATTTLVTYPR